MSYHHLTTFERGRIQALHETGHNSRSIGISIGIHHSTVARELWRNGKMIYCGEAAQEAYRKRRMKSRPLGSFTSKLCQIIEEKLSATWSPEQIANTVTLGQVSCKTIYNWLYQGKLCGGKLDTLRHKGKRHGPVERRGKFAVGLPISQRPEEVKSRETFGHWELDTMVSSRGNSKGCLATFVERKSRLYTALKIPDRSSGSMEKSISQLFKALPDGAFRSGTTDRGKEFACYQAVEDKLGLILYFADPYSSWQRGSNENANGLLREFYPKRTNLAYIDQRDLMATLFLINSRPRKCLSWKSPIQVFLHEVSHLT